MASRTGSLVLAFAMLVVAGCGMQVESTFVVIAHTPDATPTGPAHILPDFDLALAQANFTARCRDLIQVDVLFCEQVRIDDMTASGKRLTVPTTLHAGAFDRAAAICHQVAVAHVEDTGVPLGYVDIEVLDQGSDYLADCRITSS